METTRADFLSRGAKGGLALVAGGSVLVAGGSVLAMTNGRAFGSVDVYVDGESSPRRIELPLGAPC